MSEKDGDTPNIGSQPAPVTDLLQIGKQDNDGGTAPQSQATDAGQAPAAPDGAGQEDDDGDLPWSASLKEGDPLSADVLKAIRQLEKGKGVPHSAFTKATMSRSDAEKAVKKATDDLQALQDRYSQLESWRDKEALPYLMALQNNPQALALLQSALSGEQGQQQQQAAVGVVDDLRKEIADLKKWKDQRDQQDQEFYARRGEETMRAFITAHATDLDDDPYLLEKFETEVFVNGTTDLTRALKLAKLEVQEERDAEQAKKTAAVKGVQKGLASPPAGKVRTTKPGASNDPKAELIGQWQQVLGAEPIALDGFKKG